jgi:hypothetical protein
VLSYIPVLMGLVGKNGLTVGVGVVYWVYRDIF